MRSHGRGRIGAAYLAHEAARLVGVPGERIGQWARWGHIRASVSSADPHVYAFADVAEALAVHLLLDRGFTLPVIRRAVDRAGALDGLHVVDGRLAVERGEILEDVFTEHGVLPLDGRLDAAALLRAGGWPALSLGTDAVEVDPERCAGRPVVRGRRIPAEEVAADPAAFAGRGFDVGAVLRWWEAACSAS